MGCRIQPHDAANHVLGGAHIFTHCAGLHILGIPGAARQDHGRNCSRQRTQRLLKGKIMWYFSWILGVGLAMAFGIINVMWLEAEYFSKIDLEEAKGKRN